jgi:hypothetical protein
MVIICIVVVDPNWEFNADPDPAFCLHANPDPGGQANRSFHMDGSE